MNFIEYGRAFMGITLAFHIAFALFGVGFPFAISLVELLGIVRKDTLFTKMAKRWTFAMSVLFAAGAISGSVVAVTFGVLLSPFMALASKIIFLPFYIEGFAFFLEATFLGLYVYTWDRVSPLKHWLFSLPIVVASCASAFLITTVNAFMNTPQGFTYQNGVVSNVSLFSAMFNPATPTETIHSILSYYTTVAFVLAGLAAFQLLRKNIKISFRAPYYRRIVGFFLLMGFVFALATVISGDGSARFIAQYEPQKFAAAEQVNQTARDVPFKIGGDTLPVPGLLSVLVDGSRDMLIHGLNEYSPAELPPSFVHIFFDAMILLGMLLVVVPLVFGFFYFIRPNVAYSRCLLWVIGATGILSICAVEFGWLLTEFGRQPWAIYGIMLAQDAYTQSSVTMAYAFIFPLFYILLAATTFFVLVSHYRRDDKNLLS